MGFFKKTYDINKIKTDKFLAYTHLGLGDHIVCNGLLNYFSESFDKIYLPVKSRDINNINYLYKDNQKIEVFKNELVSYGVDRYFIVDVRLRILNISAIEEYDTEKMYQFISDVNQSVEDHVITTEVVTAIGDQFAFNIIDETNDLTLLEQMYDEGLITIDAMRILANDEFDLFSDEFSQRVRSMIR